MTSLTLTLPTAINATYKTGNGKFYTSDEAKAWQYEAMRDITKQFRGQGTYNEPIYVGLEFFFKRDRDIDSGIKITLDALQKYGVISNDKLIEHLNVKKYSKSDSPRVEIEIEMLK